MPEIVANFFQTLSNLWLDHLVWIVIIFGLLTIFGVTICFIANVARDEFKLLKKKIRKYRNKRKA